MKRLDQIRKLIRYTRIYGPVRTLFKAAGRSGRAVPLTFSNHRTPDIAVIGCGQFGLTHIGYFLSRRFGKRFRWCYDPHDIAASRFQRMLGVTHKTTDPSEAIADPETRLVYIASNHASHTPYALEALAAGKDVYTEKPVSTSFQQLAALNAGVAAHPERRIFAGYNRPFSRAMALVKDRLPSAVAAVAAENLSTGLSLQCAVSGHVIAPDHWYRDFDEGTRICGNAGHWIDLFLHLLIRRAAANGTAVPDRFRLTLLQADPTEPDDNFSLAIATEAGDLFSLVLTARAEPFEGINETITLQYGDLIAKIDDFRRMTLWQGTRLTRKRFWPKDVGHRAAILQPFADTPDPNQSRDWSEVLRSSILTLTVTDMVRSDTLTADISMAAELEKLEKMADHA